MDLNAKHQQHNPNKGKDFLFFLPEFYPYNNPVRERKDDWLVQCYMKLPYNQSKPVHPFRS